MKIDKTNYEIWLIDWLDGNLSDLQVEDLKLFLNNNPDLKEEFDEINAFSLKPSKKSFSKKEHLKRSVTDLSASQFEYLCIAYLENDLSAEQQTELQEIIDQNYEKKKVFDLVQKAKLTPSDIKFKNKTQLHKRTVSQNIIRLSVIGLSAAAAIALVIMTYLIIPKNLSDENNNMAVNLMVDIIPEKIAEKIKPELTIPKTNRLFVSEQKNNSYQTLSDALVLVSNDSAIRKSDNQLIEIRKISFNSAVNLEGTILSNTLIAFNYSLDPPEYDDRSNVSKFLANTFREKVLKEEPSFNRPVKGYEIAEAGVTGLNKLLGWEMALDKKNDENGELRSVYFSSKILKFNTPVNKN